MPSRLLLTAALILLAIGMVGVAATSCVASSVPVPLPLRGTSDTLGAQIYYTGADTAGLIPRTVAGGGMMGGGMMGQVACVDCHGQDGRGGPLSAMMFGTVDIPDIRYSTLTTPRTEEGTTVPAWTDADIASAIRDGVEPNGQRLKAPMPRWDMSDADLRAVIAYLKELSAR
jgi:cytochrome c oxidase subunit 2